MSESIEALYGAGDKASGVVGYLERYFDAALDVPDLDERAWRERQELRLSTALAIVITSGSIPRRLGSDATREEAALDKKRSRRVAHALATSLHAWNTKAPKLPGGEEIQRLGAQLIYEAFIPEHVTTARNELRLMVTWSIKNHKEKWGKPCVTRIQNEIAWVTYAMRD